MNIPNSYAFARAASLVASTQATRTVFLSQAQHCDEMVVELDAKLARLASRKVATTSAAIDTVRQRLAAVVSNIQRYTEPIDKQLEMKGLEHDAAIKVLESFLQQSHADVDAECMDDTVDALAHILQGIDMLPAVCILPADRERRARPTLIPAPSMTEQTAAEAAFAVVAEQARRRRQEEEEEAARQRERERGGRYYQQPGWGWPYE